MSIAEIGEALDLEASGGPSRACLRACARSASAGPRPGGRAVRDEATPHPSPDDLVLYPLTARPTTRPPWRRTIAGCAAFGPRSKACGPRWPRFGPRSRRSAGSIIGARVWERLRPRLAVSATRGAPWPRRLLFTGALAASLLLRSCSAPLPPGRRRKGRADRCASASCSWPWRPPREVAGRTPRAAQRRPEGLAHGAPSSARPMTCCRRTGCTARRRCGRGSPGARVLEELERVWWRSRTARPSWPGGDPRPAPGGIESQGGPVQVRVIGSQLRERQRKRPRAPKVQL